jgi:sulfur-oxidizing protein SoxY
VDPGCDQTSRHAAPACDVLRRRMIVGSAACVAMTALPGVLSAATGRLKADVQAEIQAATGGVAAKSGRVKLTMPELAENGNAVALSVTVESPMTADNYVKSVQIFAPENPITTVARFHFNPRSGRAKAATTIRLATSQTLIAVATMSDGSAWSGEAYVLVTLAACIDGG